MTTVQRVNVSFTLVLGIFLLLMEIAWLCAPVAHADPRWPVTSYRMGGARVYVITGNQGTAVAALPISALGHEGCR